MFPVISIGWWVMPALSSNNQKILLQLARCSIQTYLERKTAPVFESPAAEFLLPRGCFVTLRKFGKLRGCIGTFDASSPLFENIIRISAESAFSDPRFPPLAEAELKDIRIEISVLGEPQKMNSIEELELGKHGILIKYGYRQGTFLPDVATEQNWSREEFVSHCAFEKAGLSREEYALAEFFIYEVEKFSENY